MFQMDLSDACEQVCQVLNSPEFRRGLIHIINKERNLIQAQERRGNDEWDLRNLTPIELLEIDKQIIEVQRALYRFFEDCAIAKLPKPPLICADDLQYVAFTTLGGMTAVTGTIQMQRFVDHVLMRIDDDKEGEKLNLGTWTHVDDASAAKYDEFHDLAALPNGFRLRAEFELSKTFPLQTVAVTGYLVGTCTPYAMRRLTKNITPVVESLVRSIKLAATGSEMEPATNLRASIMRLIEDIDVDLI